MESWTFEQARNADFDVLQRHDNLASVNEFLCNLWKQRDTFASITKHHLHLESTASCQISSQSQWIRGSFNVCVPIKVRSRSFQKHVLVRCPLPSQLAESRYPGTVDEKMRGEIGAYAWMQRHCPQIRIPHLYGFGLSEMQFTHEAHLPVHRWLSHKIRSLFRWVFCLEPLSSYGLHNSASRLPTGYLLLEHIGPDTGAMLSDTWEEQRHNAAYRRSLFRGMANIILSLAKVPQPRIGSFCFNNDSTVTLTNRPLLTAEIILESDGIPRSIEPGETYSATESFVSDMMTLHDNRLRYDRSTADEESDCRSQMAVRLLLRATSHHFIKHKYRHGPFLLRLTDLHQSNMFVDGKGNVTCLIDLEWLCALPVESFGVPYWLTGRSIDELTGEDLAEFEPIWHEFIAALEEEMSGASLSWPILPIIRDSWDAKGFWFWSSLTSVNAAYFLMVDHLCPQYSAYLSDVEDTISPFWSNDADEVVKGKVVDYSNYLSELRRRFY
ncbi:hypothetical protein MY11210_009242 [Beauveria gryllotalpidicola]